jgi:hypothetical protein
MTDPGQSFEEIQRDLNPHRDADVRRAAETIVGQLHQKGVEVTVDEDSDELASLLSAVERFESAVEARGGDSMLNTPSSRRPENRAFVVPRRNADESVAAYIERVNAAAAALESGAGPAAPDKGGLARPDGGPR